ncbi:MAG: L,D-transpeptidase [Actinomycetota bacterium]
MIKKVSFILLAVLVILSFGCAPAMEEENFRQNGEAIETEENYGQKDTEIVDKEERVKEDTGVEENEGALHQEEAPAGENPTVEEEQAEPSGEPPTISLDIIEGPSYAQDGNICYYQVKAAVSGNPLPEIMFSKDDSNGSWGENIAQINLTEGESYTLEAKAVNEFGQSTASMLLEWKEQETQEEEIDYTDSSYFRIDVNLEEQLVRVYYKGEVIRKMVCSAGTEDHPTPTGTFRTNEKIYYSWLPKYDVGAYYFVRFYGSYLFHSIPYDEEGNIIEEEREKLGSPASHGCIRLSVEDAKWFYQTLPLGVEVYIH